jgi:hypothetical protein
MMKRTTNKLITDEKGQVMILVLILLVLGALIIAPLMGFMSTGIMAGQTIEERVEEVYAADAGIEDALHKMLSGYESLPETVGENLTYSIADVNDKDVEVVVELEEDVESFLEGLLEKDAGVHADWAASSGDPVNGTYEITVIYSGLAENKKINGVGAWLRGVNYDIIRDEFENPIFSETGMTFDYPNFTFEVRPYGGGTAFIWEWTGFNRPVFNPDAPDNEKSLTFQFTPADDLPDFYFSWLVGGSMDIGVIPEDVIIEVWKVTATATSATGKETEVTAYVSREGRTDPEPYDTVGILTWDIRLE